MSPFDDFLQRSMRNPLKDALSSLTRSQDELRKALMDFRYTNDFSAQLKEQFELAQRAFQPSAEATKFLQEFNEGRALRDSVRHLFYGHEEMQRQLRESFAQANAFRHQISKEFASTQQLIEGFRQSLGLDQKTSKQIQDAINSVASARLRSALTVKDELVASGAQLGAEDATANPQIGSVQVSVDVGAQPKDIPGLLVFLRNLSGPAWLFFFFVLSIVLDQIVRDLVSGAMHQYVKSDSETVRTEIIQNIQIELGDSSSEYVRIVNASNLRVREEPSSESVVVARLPRSALVEIVEVRGAWTQVLFLMPESDVRKIGWVASGHLRKIETRYSDSTE